MVEYLRTLSTSFVDFRIEHQEIMPVDSLGN
jgi:hypothetical protein